MDSMALPVGHWIISLQPWHFPSWAAGTPATKLSARLSASPGRSSDTDCGFPQPTVPDDSVKILMWDMVGWTMDDG